MRDVLDASSKRASSDPPPAVIDTRKRILFVEANEDGTVGGSHQALYDLVERLDPDRYVPIVLFHQDNVFAERLRSLRQQVCTFDEERRRERAVYASAGHLARNREKVAGILRRRRLFQSLQIDLLHLNNAPFVGITDWLPAAWLQGIPCVVHARCRGHPGLDWKRRWLCGRYDRVIAITRFVAQAMRESGVPEKKIEIVHDGIDAETFRRRVRRSAEDVRRELSVQPGQLLALMVGNIREWKGQHVVLDALDQLGASDRERLRVAFVGACAPADADYRRTLDRRCREMRLESCVFFTGGRSDVPDLLNAADVALHASVDPEPGGLVVLEAMTLGKAIVASNRGGPPEYLAPNCGLLHDPENPGQLAAKLRELIHDPKMRRVLGARACVRVEDYTTERTVEGVEAIYERILSA